MNVRAVAATDPGLVRSANQDLALVAESLFAVADGIGGNVGGETAARVAIDSLNESFVTSNGIAGIVRSVELANRAVFDRSEQEPELRGMGTTLTVAALVEEDGELVVGLANVGDSRAYLLSNGELRRLTDDHSVVEEMVRSGELTETEALSHPHRHIVTRAIGIDSAVEVDAWNLGPRVSGRLLLCSDGLTNECSNEEIADILSVNALDVAAHELVARANSHGGNDNITVVVVDLGDEGGDAARTIAPNVAPLTAAATRRGGTEATDERPEGAAPGAIDAPAVAAPSPDRPAPTARAHARSQTERSTSPNSASDRTLSRSSRPAWKHEPMVSVRVVAFVIVLLAVLAGAGGFIAWFNNATYYLGIRHDKVAIFEGRPGGFLWYHPSLAYQSSIATTSVISSNLPELHQGLLESSYTNARAALKRLADERSLLASPEQTTTTLPTTQKSSAVTTTTLRTSSTSTSVATTTLASSAGSKP